MPTETGAETIGERLTRLRTDQARVRATIARHENNGAGFTMGGTTVTEIAYERALDRDRELSREIAGLEGRLAGSTARPGVAVTRNPIED
jgi:hypothetical protein